MIVHRCDKCKCEYEKGPYQEFRMVINRALSFCPADNIVYRRDLCVECEDKIIAFLKKMEKEED